MGKTKFTDVNRTKQSTSNRRVHALVECTVVDTPPQMYIVLCCVAIKDYFVHLPHLFSRALPLNRFPYLCRKIEKKQTH